MLDSVHLFYEDLNVKKALLGFVLLMAAGAASASNRCGAINEIYASPYGGSCNLQPNDYLENGAFRLYMQADGNVVLYQWFNSGKALWATNTDGKGGTFFQAQTDGNVVLYRSDATPVWSSNTGGRAAAYTRLRLIDGPKLVIEYGQNPTITTTIYSAAGTPPTCTTARSYPICVFPNSPSRFTSFVLACNAQEAAAQANASGAILGACP